MDCGLACSIPPNYWFLDEVGITQNQTQVDAKMVRLTPKSFQSQMISWDLPECLPEKKKGSPNSTVLLVLPIDNQSRMGVRANPSDSLKRRLTVVHLFI